MLTAYIGAAMHRAEYEKLEVGSYYGEIVGLHGVYADGVTLKRAELSSKAHWRIGFSSAS